jgi:hypothetical protein
VSRNEVCLPPEDPHVIVIEIRGPLSATDLRRLHDRVAAALQDPGVHGIVCLLAGVVDLGVVDALARVHLLAGRRGRRLRVRAGGQDVMGLLEVTGLASVLSLE